MDDVFRALADPTRRDLLDRLYREDGQTLRALAADYPMTRIGVMKHLQILEDARLVVTKRRGREKLHFLNPIPIRLVHDRWVSKYAEPWVATLSDIKQQLEQSMEKIFEIYIRTTPERLWEAITDSEIRAKFQFGNRSRVDMGPGIGVPGDQRPRRRSCSSKERTSTSTRRAAWYRQFRAVWGEDVQREGTTRVTWEIEPVGDSCHLTVTHDQLREDANAQIFGGWPMILSGLKTWIETGETLTTPGSLMYA